MDAIEATTVVGFAVNHACASVAVVTVVGKPKFILVTLLPPHTADNAPPDGLADLNLSDHSFGFGIPTDS